MNEQNFLNRNTKWVKNQKNAMHFTTYQYAKEMAEEILNLPDYCIEKIQSKGETYYCISRRQKVCVCCSR